MKHLFLLPLFFILTACTLEEAEQQQKNIPSPSPTSTTAAQPAPVINVYVNNSANGGSATSGDSVSNSAGGNATGNGGSSSATGGSNNNSISSGNSSASGGTGGSASAGNSTSSSNNTSSNTNSGSASNQANNSTNNSADVSQNQSNQQTQTNTQTVDISQTTDVNVENDLELIAGLLSGRVKETDDNNACDDGCKKKCNKHSCFCVKKKEAKSKKGLQCSLYDLKTTQPSSLPNFSSMTPVYKFTTETLDVADQDWQNGFPKITDSSIRSAYLEWYGVRCQGSLKVDKADSYTFYVSSDDGVEVSLDSSVLVSNKSLHAVTVNSATKSLTKGKHDILVDYYQGPRTRIALVLEWMSSTMSRRLVEGFKH